MVTVVPETLVVTFVPPVKVNVPEVVRALPEPESAAKVIEVTVPVPGALAQVLSPRKKVEALADPVAERSAVMVPVLVIVPPETSTKVPLLVAIEVTVPEPPASQAGPPPELTVNTSPTEPIPNRLKAVVPLAVKISHRV